MGQISAMRQGLQQKHNTIATSTMFTLITFSTLIPLIPLITLVTIHPHFQDLTFGVWSVVSLDTHPTLLRRKAPQDPAWE